MGGKALIGLGCLAVGLVVGYGAGRVSTGTPLNPLSDQKSSGYEKGYEAAVEELSESGSLPPSVSESTTIDGTVKSVSGGRLTLDANIAIFDPLGTKSLPKERLVTVTDATVVVKLTEMTPEELLAAQAAYQKELAAYEPSLENTSPPPAPPSTTKETPIALTDLKAGDTVIVTAASDIVAAASFEAVRITLAPPTTQAGGPDQSSGAPGLPFAAGETPPPAPPSSPPSDAPTAPPAAPAP